MIVLDASVIIAFLDADDKHHARAEELLAREIDDELGANALTLAEVLVAPTPTEPSGGAADGAEEPGGK